MVKNRKCAVYGCNTHTKEKEDSIQISFHLIPRLIKVARKWVLFMRNPDISLDSLQNQRLRNRTFVCSKHFKEEDFVEFKRRKQASLSIQQFKKLKASKFGTN